MERKDRGGSFFFGPEKAGNISWAYWNKIKHADKRIQHLAYPTDTQPFGDHVVILRRHRDCHLSHKNSGERWEIAMIAGRKQIEFEGREYLAVP